MLGPAAQHDLGSPGHRGENRPQVFGGPIVGDLYRQLVEAVEQQHQLPACQHPAHRADVDGLLAGYRQMLGQQRVQAVVLLQCPQFDEYRYQIRQDSREPTGKLP